MALLDKLGVSKITGQRQDSATLQCVLIILFAGRAGLVYSVGTSFSKANGAHPNSLDFPAAGLDMGLFWIARKACGLDAHVSVVERTTSAQAGPAGQA